MTPLRFASCLWLASLLLLQAATASAIDVERPAVRAFIDSMVAEHGYDEQSLVATLGAAQSQPAILEAISRPAEKTLTWPQYRAIFITDERIEAGVRFWREHADALERISEGTGVAPEILVGIIGVETYFGRITGKYRVLDALATLAFDYPPRSSFFMKELAQFLLLVREEEMQPTAATGSYAGAMGAPQFMPSSFRAYAVDASDDGKRDIWNDWQDVIGSVANYFVEHGWRKGMPVTARATLGTVWDGPLPANTLKATETVRSLSDRGVVFATDLPDDHAGQLVTLEGESAAEYWVGFHNFFVITRYNRSVMYAMAVHQLGQEIAVERERRVSTAG
jgi:membrane-bound lytic murein transglycosylase B